MSGCSYNTTCPVCASEELNAYEDHKPFDNVCGQCLDCGFSYSTIIDKRLDLDELNDLRHEDGQKKLTKKEYNKYSKEDFNF